MSNTIKYPFAIQKSTNNIVDPSMVVNGLKCDCKCFSCDENLIAINKGKKQKSHFRHDVNGNCGSNLESFYHWASKEILKELNSIDIPEISLEFDDFPELQTILSNYGIPHEYTLRGKIILQEKTILKIEKTHIEKVFNTSLGDIRADVAVENKNHFLLIEPYYKNPIDESKFEKLNLLDYSTLSISLLPFAQSNGFIFSLKTFKTFLSKDLSHKNWVTIRSNKLTSLKKNYIKKFKTELDSKINSINQLSTLVKQKKDIKNEVSDWHQKINALDLKKHQLIYKIRELEKKLDLNYAKDNSAYNMW
jgi:hypothetical protein